MMKRKRGIAPLAAALGVLLLVSLLAPVTAFAGQLDVTQPASLTIRIVHEGTGIGGARFEIYQIADLTSAGDFAVQSAYSGYAAQLSLDDPANWDGAALALRGYLERDGVQPTASGVTGDDGKLAFRQLSAGLYLVVGHPVSKDDGYTYTPMTCLIRLPNTVDGSDWVSDVEITNKYTREETPGDGETVELKALKAWKDGDREQRPTSVTVQLLCGSKVYDTQTLNEANNWRYTWEGLDAAEEWLIVEQTVPEGYTVSTSREGATFLLTNTYGEKTPGTTPTPGGKLPQTGQLWWPVPVLLCGGLVFLLIGILRRKTDPEGHA